VRALAVTALGVLCGVLLLPAQLCFTPRTGHRGLLGSAVAREREAFLAGRLLTIQLPGPDPGAGTLALRVRLRRASNPVTVRIERDGVPLGGRALLARPEWLEAPLEPETRLMRLRAEDERQVFETLYLVERLELRRRIDARRVAIVMLPGLVGGFVASRRLGSRLVAALWGFHAALGTAGLLAFVADPLATLQFEPQVWRVGGVALAVSAATLLLVPRLLERNAPEPRPRLRPRHVAAAATLAGSVVLGIAGLLAGSSAALRATFGERVLADPDLLPRARASRELLFGSAAALFYAGLFAGTARGLDRLGERGLFLLVAGVSSLSLIGAAEGLLAPRYPPVYRPGDPNAWARRTRATYLADPELGHVLNPESENPYRINEYGLRGASFPRVKPRGEWRIAAMGDSIPFGSDLPEAAPFAVQLEKMLQARESAGRAYRALNAGVPAYDSLQTLRAFRRVVKPLAPDVITVTVGWNDLAWSLGPNWYPERSIAYRWNPPRFRPALVRFAEELQAPATLRRSEPDPRALRAFHDNLAALARQAGSGGVRVLLTNLPTVLSLAGNTDEELRIARGKLDFEWRLEDVRRFQAQIDAVCGELPEIACVRDIFPLAETGKGGYFLDHCHPNALGHEQIAARLLRALEERGWL
jgi:lysophospholipase L1-like esterase